MMMVPSKRKNSLLAVLSMPSGIVSTTLLVVVLVMAVVAPLLLSEQADQRDLTSILRGPSASHIAGTDVLGRDILLRVLVATGLSVGLALSAAAITIAGGVLLGSLPLFLGKHGGRAVTAVINVTVAFPGLLLALFFAVIFGVGAHGAVLAIGLAGIPSFARLTHNLTTAIEGLDYVAAARLAGISRMRLLLRHVLPNIGEPLLVNAAIGSGASLLAFSGLSFLGLGVQQPQYDWGRLLNEGLEGIYINPLAAIVPGTAIIIAGLSFNLFGEAAARALGVGRHSAALGSAPAKSLEEPAAAADDALLTVENLRVSFPGESSPVTPVRGVSFTIMPGESVGIVGESGSGKSLTALAIAQLIDKPGVVTADRLEFQGQPLGARRDSRFRHWLGTQFAMVFQDPMASFTPTMRVGRQLAEVGREHQGLTRGAALEKAIDRLRDVRLTEPERNAHQFPHELSGGMRQRAMIGMGIMGDPALIVADEPTTALDATVQKQILELLAKVRRENGLAILLISHDITIINEMCDRVLVMYGGRIIEDLPSSALLMHARHPYTRALVGVVPDMGTNRNVPLPVIPGSAIEAAEVGVGCAYAPRCPLADERCRTSLPELEVSGHGGRVACWNADAMSTPTGAEVTEPMSGGEQRDG